MDQQQGYESTRTSCNPQKRRRTIIEDSEDEQEPIARRRRSRTEPEGHSPRKSVLRDTGSVDTHRTGVRNSLFIESDEYSGTDTRLSSPRRVIRNERNADGHPIAELAQHGRGHRNRRRNELDILLSTPNTLGAEEVPALASSHRNSAYKHGPRQVKQEEVSEGNPTIDQSLPIARASNTTGEGVNNQLDEVQGNSTRITNRRRNGVGLPNLGEKDDLNADKQDDEEALASPLPTENSESRRREPAGSASNSSSAFEDRRNANELGSGGGTMVPRMNTRKVAATTDIEHGPVQDLLVSTAGGQQTPLPGQAVLTGPVLSPHHLGPRRSGNTDRAMSTSVETISPAPALGKESRTRTSNENIVATTTTIDLTSRRSRTEDEDTANEDERLLASEEGKKLSSTDRRRLRNKISAKAHRSRRRGYIARLEEEAKQKTLEINELRAKNDAITSYIAILEERIAKKTAEADEFRARSGMLMKQVHLLREQMILNERVEEKNKSSNLLPTNNRTISQGPEPSYQVNTNSPSLATNPISRQNEGTEFTQLASSSVNLPNSLDEQFKQLRAMLRDTTNQTARSATTASSAAPGSDIALTITPALSRLLQTRKERHLSDSNVQRLLAAEEEVTKNLAPKKIAAITDLLASNGTGHFTPAFIEQELLHLHELMNKEEQDPACCEDTRQKTSQSLTATHRKEINELKASHRATVDNMALVHHNDIQNLTAAHRGEMRRIIGTIRQGMNAAVDFAASQIPGEDRVHRTLSPTARSDQVRQSLGQNTRPNYMASDQATTVLLQPRAMGSLHNEQR